MLWGLRERGLGDVPARHLLPVCPIRDGPCSCFWAVLLLLGTPVFHFVIMVVASDASIQKDDLNFD